jgi:vacuolar-type H+-ATPase subunit E/Vma4
MAAKPISQPIKDSVIADWRTGEYSQRELAHKYEVSAGLVAKLTKGIEQDTSSIVSAGIEYRQGLASHDERNVSAISNAVDERIKHIQFFTDVTVKNINVLANKIDESLSIVDHRHAQEAIAKARDTVLGKEANTQVNIQNNTTINADVVAGAKELLLKRLANTNDSRLINP